MPGLAYLGLDVRNVAQRCSETVVVGVVRGVVGEAVARGRLRFPGMLGEWWSDKASIGHEGHLLILTRDKGHVVNER